MTKGYAVVVLAHMLLGRRGMRTASLLCVLTSTFLTSLVGACATEADDDDPVLDDGGKADGFSPPSKGSIDLGAGAGQSAVSFTTEDDELSSMAYVTFELLGPATVTFETKYFATADAAQNDVNRELDTVLYVYKPDGSRWGRYLAKDDDGGWGLRSKLAADLDAGSYRLLVKHKNGSGTPTSNLAFSCEGDGCVSLASIIEDAVSLGEIDPELGKTVELADMPAAVRAAAERATEEIRNRSFPDSDYSADVDSYAAVYRSAADPTIVAYVVLGYGSGEPDYEERIVVGLSLTGDVVYDEVESE